MNKFKVGDIVSFDYDNKRGEGKIVEVPNDRYSRYVVELLGDLRGTGHNCSARCGLKYHGSNCWNVSESVMQLIKREEIHITRQGNTVHAVMKDGNKVVKRSKAVCSKEDTFDFETGAKLAIDRLFDGIDDLKPGDYIKLKDCFDGLGNCAPDMSAWAGKVVTVDSMPRQSEQPGSKFYIKIKEDGGLWNWNDWFIQKKTTEAPKKDYEPLEVYPGLVYTGSRKYYGKIGTPTSMEDIRGEQLFIGDVVTLVSKRGVNNGKEFVCEDKDDQFVMGIRSDCHADGKIDGWTVIKEKSYEDVEHDERYGAVAAKMYD